jgi:hypothetical protein
MLVILGVQHQVHEVPEVGHHVTVTTTWESPTLLRVDELLIRKIIEQIGKQATDLAPLAFGQGKAQRPWLVNGYRTIRREVLAIEPHTTAPVPHAYAFINPIQAQYLHILDHGRQQNWVNTL